MKVILLAPRQIIVNLGEKNYQRYAIYPPHVY